MLNNVNKLISTEIALQIISIVCFLYFVYLSSEVLSGDETGQFGLWLHYAGYAGISFYSAVGIWVITLLTVIFSKSYKSLIGRLAIFIAPTLALFYLLVLWYIESPQA